MLLISIWKTDKNSNFYVINASFTKSRQQKY